MFLGQKVNRKVPQVNPKANYLAHKDEIDDAIDRVLRSGNYILGEEVHEFEQSFARYIGTNYCVGVANGTDAIRIALVALGVGVGDEVIVPSFTAIATISGIVQTGAIPVYADISPQTLTVSSRDIETRVTDKTVAIVPVHIYGNPCRMDEIMRIANQNNLWVVEDCAQAHGAAYAGKRVGSIGHIASWSFYPSKNLGCIGDGGAITTNSGDLHAKASGLQKYGWADWKLDRVSRYHGINSRLDELQAVVLSVKLGHLDHYNSLRGYVARIYNDSLKGSDNYELTSAFVGAKHCHHQYILKLSGHVDRGELRKFMLERGVETGVHYPIPCHLQDGYKQEVTLPITEMMADRVLSLPMYPEMTVGDICRVVDAIKEYFNQ